MVRADVDAQVLEIGALLSARVDELARRVAAAIRAEVDFYRTTDVVSDDELVSATAANLTFVFQGLEVGAGFDTSPAVATGHKRAAAGAPLPAVMDAFRVASHVVWDTMIEFAGEHPRVSGSALIVATSRFWNAQDRYTEAMTAAFRQQAMHQAIEDEAERSALAEALFEGRLSADYSLWDVAQMLHLPGHGPYAIVAAALPALGRQALPGVEPLLRSLDVFSAWRLLPDLQMGIVHVASQTAMTRMLELFRRLTDTAVGISPLFDDLADAARALRYARIAMGAGRHDDDNVTVFDDSVLTVAAVSAPEVTRKLAEITLGSFNDLPADERDTLVGTFRAWVDNDGSIQQTASVLFCHPNTVRYRLRRIEERTGRSLSVPRQLAELCLAFEVDHHV